jgi:hypothetical protein
VTSGSMTVQDHCDSNTVNVQGGPPPIDPESRSIHGVAGPSVIRGKTDR